MNLLTIADGFGDSRAFPDWYPSFLKWPEIIKLMTRGVNLFNLSRYGAGNEYIIQCLRNNFGLKDAVLIQWAVPNRLDLIMSHDKEYTDFWQQQIANDPVYHSNVVAVGDSRMWISSASSIDPVIEYHKKFIGIRQHQLRSQLYIDYATLLLQNLQHGFLLTHNSDYLRETLVDTTNWYWHEEFKGMNDFRKYSKYADLDIGIAQPIPLIYFDFIRKFIQPKFDLPWRSERDILGVENMLYRKHSESIQNRTQ